MLIMLFLHVNCTILLNLWSKMEVVVADLSCKYSNDVTFITRDSILMIVIKPAVNSS